LDDIQATINDRFLQATIDGKQFHKRSTTEYHKRLAATTADCAFLLGNGNLLRQG
jgi:hypothetical protein